MAEENYIKDHEEATRTAEGFMQEFKDNIYPTYASFGLNFYEALSIWKLNVIYNQLADIQEELQKDGY